MSLRIVVTVKQVPDTHNVSGDAMKPDGTVNRAALPTIFNPEDLNALEEALRFKDQFDAEVIALSMGPAKACEVLKECLYRGADDAILISDIKFAGADTLATSYALKSAIEKIGKVDLIFCGRQAIDGDTAQVGPQIAEKLGINQLTSVTRVITREKNSITVQRTLPYGDEIVKSKFPLLVTVTSDVNEPRYPKVKRVLSYKGIKREGESAYEDAYLGEGKDRRINVIKEWNVEKIGANVSECGLNGSPTKVKKIENVVLAASSVKKIDNTFLGISSLINELKQEHILG